MILIILFTIFVLFFLGRHLGLQINLIFAIFMSGLLLFTCLVFYNVNLYYYIGLLLLMIDILIYLVLYSTRGLEKSLVSFIFFSINFFTFIFFTFSLLCLPEILDNNIPILLFEDISDKSKYKYLFLSIMCFFFLLIYIHSLLNENNFSKKLSSFFAKPVFFSNSMDLMETWEDVFFGQKFMSLISAVVNKKKIRIVFFLINTFFYYLVPGIVFILWIKIIFFKGNLFILFFVLPFSFFAWLYKHVYFYFIEFVKKNEMALLSYLDIFLLEKPITISNTNVLLDTSKISFKLSKKALIEFKNVNNDVLLKGFSKDFLLIGRCHAILLSYQETFYKYNLIILGIRLLLWFYIATYFFFPFEYIFAVNYLTLFVPRCYSSVRPYATAAYAVKKTAQAALEAATNGAYKKGHFATTDLAKIDSNGDIPIYHQGTHGPGPQNNPSKILHPTEDYSGVAGSGPQKAVYPDPALGQVRFPASALGKEIPGSISFYDDALVKNNDMKNRGGTKPDYEN